MSTKTIYYLFLCCFVSILFSCKTTSSITRRQQSLRFTQNWEKLNGYPLKHGRTDDLYFFNPDRGFAINSQGYLLLTEDGGGNWETKFRKERTFFRCLTFKDSLTGFLGNAGAR